MLQNRANMWPISGIHKQMVPGVRRNSLLRTTSIVSICAISAACWNGLSQPPSEHAAWVISSLARAKPTDPAGIPSSVTLYAARGEFEAFQILTRFSGGPQDAIQIIPPALDGPDGATIPSSSFSLYAAKYVEVTRASPTRPGSSNASLGAGWYPDGLIPMENSSGADLYQPLAPAKTPVETKIENFRAVWVDLYVPRSALPGIYHGQFTVISGPIVTPIPVVLHVWDFELPLRPSLKSSFLYWGERSKAADQLLLRHKLMPQKLFSCRIGRNGSACLGAEPDEREAIDRFGLNTTDVRFWSGADNRTCLMSPAPSVAAFRQAKESHASDLELYNYTADEIDGCPNLSDRLKEWARNMHAAGIRNLVTMVPRPELFDDGSGTGRTAVDTWVVLPFQHERNASSIQEAQQRGHEVWSYNALVQDSYSPKWLVDFAPINLRIQAGFLSQNFALAGLLYWRVDWWPGDPWNQVNNTGLMARNANYPGEGMLVYPGPPVGFAGVLPSMRLKQLREGVEDYEYVELLKRAGRGKFALDLVRKAAPDWRNWTRDERVLLDLRRELGQELDRLGRLERAASARAREQKPRVISNK